MPDRILTSAQAINEALAIMGERDKNILLMGQGIDDKGAFYGTTAGLRPIYGDRLIETPVSENAMVGVAVGLSISGKRPVIQFHRVEFALLAMEQIINNAAKMHYISNGQHKCPLVIRMIVGRGWGQGPEHSQSLEAMFAYIPGLRVLMPTFPEDYKGMLIAAIEDDNPVVIIEHRWTHYVKGHVPDGYYKSDITKPKRLQEGEYCTIVATSYSSLGWLKEGNTEVFDLRVLRPLNIDEIRESVRKTKRLVFYDTGYKTGGIGAEIVAQLIEEGLQFSLTRKGLPDHPVPSSRGYLPGIYPDGGGDQPNPEFVGPF
jgi:pyruvate/2-oxoglutarate/acetoin dehydrogenase E1 component